MSEDSLQIVYVDQTTLRQRFNSLDYYGQVRRGELTPVVYWSKLAPPSAGQPAGTLSQFVHYRRGPTEVARVHQYRRIDGTLGASGLPDPKWIRDGDTILMLAPR